MNKSLQTTPHKEQQTRSKLISLKGFRNLLTELKSRKPLPSTMSSKRYPISTLLAIILIGTILQAKVIVNQCNLCKFTSI